MPNAGGTMQKIKIGISSCLLGHPVRYDGRHKLQPGLRGRLERYVEFVPICPEVLSGMGIPREPMNLEGKITAPRLITHNSRTDKTGLLKNWAEKEVERLAAENLCGFIFKSGSPSCGLEKVKVYADKGAPVKSGMGIFTRAFTSRHPLLPVTDELRLGNVRRMENYIETVLTLQRWRETRSCSRLTDAWREFHRHHHLLLLAHSRELGSRMDRLLAVLTTKDKTVEVLLKQYEKLLFKALQLKTTPAKNALVLHKIRVCLKKRASAAENETLARMSADCRQGLKPLYACLALARRYAEKYDCEYLRQQVCLNPHPLLLQLQKCMWRFR